jgi:hypothetical protein
MKMRYYIMAIMMERMFTITVEASHESFAIAEAQEYFKNHHGNDEGFCWKAFPENWDSWEKLGAKYLMDLPPKYHSAYRYDT